MTYIPPTDDMKFALRYLAGFDDVTALPPLLIQVLIWLMRL